MRRAVIVLTAAGLLAAAGAIVFRPGPGPGVSPDPRAETVTVRRADLVSTERINGTLGYPSLPPVVVHRAGTYTALPEEGTTVEAGQSLVTIDDLPVVLLPGAKPAYRAIQAGMADGGDVQQLETALTALGFDPSADITVDAHFSWATAAAIRRLQSSFGVAETGTFELGDVVFEPAPLRVGHLQARLGARATPGDEPFAATGTTPVVSVELPATRQRGIVAGEAVTVDLLDGTTTTGTVTGVARVATPSAPATGAGPAGPTIAVTVGLSDPEVAGASDQVPVQIEVVVASRRGVLVVPVTALVALAEGGEGLETVDAAGRHHFVAVTTGLFADTLVEITAGVAERTAVVVAR